MLGLPLFWCGWLGLFTNIHVRVFPSSDVLRGRRHARCASFPPPSCTYLRKHRRNHYICKCKLIFFSPEMTHARSRWVVSRAHVQAFAFSWENHGRLSVVNIFKLSRRKKLVHTCWTPWSTLQKKGDLWARPTVLTPVPSQANHSSSHRRSRRVRNPRNSHTCFDSLDRVSQQQRCKNQKNTSFRSLVGSLGLVDMGTRSSRSRQRWTRRCDKEQCWQKTHHRMPKAVSRLTRADCGRGWLQQPHTATENRPDYDHGRHRPATESPTQPVGEPVQCRLRS